MPAKAYASGGDKYQGSNSNVQSCESPLALNCADSQQSSFALSIRAPTSAQGVQPGCTLACSRDRSPVRDGVLGHSLLDLMHPPRRRERRRTLLSTRPEERGDDSPSCGQGSIRPRSLGAFCDEDKRPPILVYSRKVPIGYPRQSPELSVAYEGHRGLHAQANIWRRQ